jgi:hypothetical protein
VGSLEQRDGSAHDAASGGSRHVNQNRVLAPERLAYLAGRIHALGPRPLCELFHELQAGAPLHERLERYAALPADFIKALGGDRLPPPHIVPGGRDDAA